MHAKKIAAMLIVGMAFATIMIQARAGAPSGKAGCSWLATGTITKTDGSTFYLLGKDNVVYTVDAGRAELLSEFTTDSRGLSVGDTVRVYGTVTGPNSVAASRVRVLVHEAAQGEESPKKEIKIIYERPQEEKPAEGAGPQVEIKPQPEDGQ